VPLVSGGEVLGVLDIQSQEANAFDENDQAMFEALAAAVAVAMRNANLYRSEQWRRRVAESFRDVANVITANLPLNELLDLILARLEDVLPCDGAAIWLLHERTAPMRRACGWRRPATLTSTISLKRCKPYPPRCSTGCWRRTSR
jgi:phosphoserine phosphatase RsbU/P